MPISVAFIAFTDEIGVRPPFTLKRIVPSLSSEISVIGVLSGVLLHVRIEGFVSSVNDVAPALPGNASDSLE